MPSHGVCQKHYDEIIREIDIMPISFINNNNSFDSLFSKLSQTEKRKGKEGAKVRLPFDQLSSRKEVLPLDQYEKFIFSRLREIIAQNGLEGVLTPFVAGGWVRDKFLGVPSKDIDIAVDYPEPLVGAGKMYEVITGQKYDAGKDINKIGTTKVRVKDLLRPGEEKIIPPEIQSIDLEFTPFRQESYGDTNKPILSGGTMEDEVTRRDFTINSLLYDISDGEVIDYSGKGISDLKNRILRTTNSNPYKTFYEDPDRIMRLFRFVAQLGFDIAPETFEAVSHPDFQKMVDSNNRGKNIGFTDLNVLKQLGIRADSPENKIKATSKQQKLQQFYKMLSLDSEHKDSIEKSLYLMKDSGILRSSLGMGQDYHELETPQLNRHHVSDSIFDHIMRVVDASSDYLPEEKDDRFVLRMSALLHDMGKFHESIRVPVKETNKNYQPGIHEFSYSGHEEKSAEFTEDVFRDQILGTSLKDRVKSLVKKHGWLMELEQNGKNIDAVEIRKLASEIGNPKDFDNLISLMYADRAAHHEEMRSTDEIDQFKQKYKDLPEDHIFGKPKQFMDVGKIFSLLSNDKKDKKDFILDNVMNLLISGKVSGDPTSLAIRMIVENNWTNANPDGNDLMNLGFKGSQIKDAKKMAQEFILDKIDNENRVPDKSEVLEYLSKPEDDVVEDIVNPFEEGSYDPNNKS